MAQRLVIILIKLAVRQAVPVNMAVPAVLIPFPTAVAVLVQNVLPAVHQNLMRQVALAVHIPVLTVAAGQENAALPVRLPVGEVQVEAVLVRPVILLLMEDVVMYRLKIGVELMDVNQFLLRYVRLQVEAL